MEMNGACAQWLGCCVELNFIHNTWHHVPFIHTGGGNIDQQPRDLGRPGGISSSQRKFKRHKSRRQTNDQQSYCLCSWHPAALGFSPLITWKWFVNDGLNPPPNFCLLFLGCLSFSLYVRVCVCVSRASLQLFGKT